MRRDDTAHLSTVDAVRAIQGDRPNETGRGRSPLGLALALSPSLCLQASDFAAPLGKMASDLAVKEKVNREVLGALAKQKQSNSMAYMGNKPAVRFALAHRTEPA